MEKAKEEEVRAAYISLQRARKKGKTIPIGSLLGQTFTLFCSGHVDYFYSDIYSIKRVEFYSYDDEGDACPETKPGSKVDMLYGNVYLDANTYYEFGPFRPPKRASRKAIKVKGDDGKYELSFKFLGNGYLKLRVSREMVFMGWCSPPTLPRTAPDVFKFVGIWFDRKKKMAERSETLSSETPSSPQTWFKVNHRRRYR
jgi:hypothetical protein